MKAIIPFIVVLMMAAGAQSSVLMETVPVGNAGNANDTAVDGHGTVGYEYNIGKFEVTAGQYSEFLNAVAATDAFGLYSTSMWSGIYACNIERTGVPGSYTYSVAADWANRPVSDVSWGDAARFANWMHNGQPVGPQGVGTTEDGSYFLDGAITNTELMAVSRTPAATWVIPSEDEWYKAAYHKNDGVTGNYFTYPTSSNSLPGNVLVDPDPGNSATFYASATGYTVGPAYYRTEAGDHENSASPYGTFDQGGNVWEWIESPVSNTHRVNRGGTFHFTDIYMQSDYRTFNSPTSEYGGRGFRVAEVPEPATATLLLVGGSAVFLRRRRVHP